jgi:hypothetical protein
MRKNPNSSENMAPSPPKCLKIARTQANGASSGLMMMATANWRFSMAMKQGGRRYGTRCGNAVVSEKGRRNRSIKVSRLAR